MGEEGRKGIRKEGSHGGRVGEVRVRKGIREEGNERARE